LESGYCVVAQDPAFQEEIKPADYDEGVISYRHHHQIRRRLAGGTQKADLTKTKRSSLENTCFFNRNRT
jgi:hypothetical protein